MRLEFRVLPMDWAAVVGCAMMVAGSTTTDFEIFQADASRAAARLDRSAPIRSLPDMSLPRHRLAQDLHDHAGQAIAILLLDLQRLGAFIPCAQGLEHLARIRHDVDQMGNDLHRLAVDLRPDLLEHGGLADACRSRAEQFRRACPVMTDFEVLGDCSRIPDSVADALFHVFQEALTNVVRHGRGVTRVAMRLARRRDAIVIAVADDGLPPADRPCDAPMRRGGLGLAGMRGRVMLLGGRIRMVRPTTGGWSVCAAIPLRDSSDMKERAHAPDLLGR